MSRQEAIDRVTAYFDEGRFFEDLSRRVAIPTESENEDRVGEIAAYLTDEKGGSLCEERSSPRFASCWVSAY